MRGCEWSVLRDAAFGPVGYQTVSCANDPWCPFYARCTAEKKRKDEKKEGEKR